MARKYVRKAKLCGAKRRNGERCAKPAGWGTDHNGSGKCKYHGGATPSGPKSAHFKTGIYAEAFKRKFRAHYLAATDDSRPFELLPEFNAQRAMYRAFVEQVTDNESVDLDTMERVIHLSETVIRTAAKIIEARNKTALTTAEIEFIQTGLRSGIEKYVDADKRQDFIDHIRSFLPGWSDAGEG